MGSGGGTGHQTFSYEVIMVRQPDRGSRSMSGHPKDGCLPEILLVLVVLCVCSLHPLASSIQQSFSVELCILLDFFFLFFYSQAECFPSKRFILKMFFFLP